MFGIWSFLRQFMYTKFIVVTDDDVDIRNWPDVIWAITTRMDPVRDTVLVDRTPIDYLDFASPVSGLGGKMGLDATTKWPRRDRARMGPADPPRPGGRGAGGERRRRDRGGAPRLPADLISVARPRAALFFAAAGAGGSLRRRSTPPLRFVPACSPSDMPIRTPLASAA